MVAMRRPPPSRTTLVPSATAAAATLVLLLPLHPRAGAQTHTARATPREHVPFGYQSNSAHSIEYRNDGPDSADPSTYAGSIHYDPLHHALYVTGATFASQVFDGVDVFALTTEEEAELEDNSTVNDGYWWDEHMTELAPHLQDPGVPDYSPLKGDCFYAVLGLPVQGAAPSAGENANEVKLVHSRRFGSEGAAEACSAIDILPTSIHKESPGGYAHEFEFPNAMEYMEEHDVLNPYPGAAAGPPAEYLAEMMAGRAPSIAPHPPYTHNPTFDHGAAPFTGFPTLSPAGADEAGVPSVMTKGETLGTTSPHTTTTAPTYYPTVTSMPSPTDGLTYEPTITPPPSPTEGLTYVPTSSPIVAGEPGEGMDRRRRLVGEGNGPGQISEMSLSSPQQLEQQQHRRAADADDTTPYRPRRISTRSVRLLMAGHVESQTGREGYAIDDLEPGTFDDAKVYAFAQQVDVRLPAGDVSTGMTAQATLDAANAAAGNDELLTYNLHTEGHEEDAFVQENGPGYAPGVPKGEYAKIVTSGVESRALLNEDLPRSLQTVYPVAIAADTTSKTHYYVVLLASDDPDANLAFRGERLNVDPTVGQGAGQKSRAEYYMPLEGTAAREGDLFGHFGRPNYGNDFRIVVKKVQIEVGIPESELTAVDLKLSAESYGGGTMTMRQTWAQEFEPDRGEDARPAGLLFAPSGKPDGEGDMLIVVGTTAGRGDAFGTTDSKSYNAQDGPELMDLDGFVTKIEADGGEFAGREKLDFATNTFINTFSKRIRSNPGQTEIVASVCAKPHRAIGRQDTTDHVYVVGSTSALLEGSDPGDVRSPEFLAAYAENAGVSQQMEAFLMKINLKTMNVAWTQQIGAFVPGENRKGDAFGYGCAVTRDGEDVYLSGLVRADGVATDFSDKDFTATDNNAVGGTDIFVASYKTSNGERNFIRQIGSTRDDYPSRGNGGITTDRFGDAILTGNTRGSLMRQRDEDEYRYGPSRDDAAADVFVLSLARDTGMGPPVMHDGVDERNPPVVYTHVPPAPAPAPRPVTDFAGAEEDVETESGAIGVVVLLCIGLSCAAAGAAFFVVRRIQEKGKEKRALTESDRNLHTNGRDNGPSDAGRNLWRWGRTSRRQSSAMDDFSSLNIMVEVRNSASGGWHGVYDDEQLQAIDFNTPGGAGVHVGSGDEGDQGDILENALFMEDGLKEIEDGLDSYEIGEMDDVSDEDLIRAYNDAMALDIEPENEDVEFAMAGIGSATLLDEDSSHHIT